MRKISIFERGSGYLFANNDTVYAGIQQLYAKMMNLCLTYGKQVYFRHYAAYSMLSFNPIMVEGYATLFSCAMVVQTSKSMTALM